METKLEIWSQLARGSTFTQIKINAQLHGGLTDRKTIKRVAEELEHLSPVLRRELPDDIREYAEGVFLQSVKGSMRFEDADSTESNSQLDCMGEAIPADEVDAAILRLNKLQLMCGDSEIDGLTMFLALGTEFAVGVKDWEILRRLKSKLGGGDWHPDFNSVIGPLVLAGVIYSVHVAGAPPNSNGLHKSLHAMPYQRYLLTGLGRRVFIRCEEREK